MMNSPKPSESRNLHGHALAHLGSLSSTPSLAQSLGSYKLVSVLLSIINCFSIPTKQKFVLPKVTVNTPGTVRL